MKKSIQLINTRIIIVVFLIISIILILCFFYDFDIAKSLAASDNLPIEKMDEFTLKFSTHLPIVVIQTTVDLLKSRTDPPGAVIWYFDNGTENRLTDKATEVFSYATVKYRGNSSYFFPVPGYSLEFFDNNYLTTLDVSFFDLEPANEWVMRTPYADPSLLRDWFSYELAASVMQWQPRGGMIQLFRQDGKSGLIEYIGVFYLCQYIPAYAQSMLSLGDFSLNVSETVDLAGGGYLIQYNGGRRNTRLGVDKLFLMYPDRRILTHQQEKLMLSELKFYNRLLSSDEKQHEAHEPGVDCEYSRYIDIDSFVNYYLVSELIKMADRGTASVYMYRPNGEKLYGGPIWDCDAVMGRGHSGQEPYYEFNTWGHKYHDDIIYNLLECNTITEKICEKWQEYRADIWTDDILLSRMDFMIAYLEVPAAQSNIVSWREETDLIREWLMNRLTWLDENIPRLINETPKEINGD